MINGAFAIGQRPERGWDPVPEEHHLSYAETEWTYGVNEVLLENLEEWTGGFEGKNILDLGGGPGQYSVAFARRGAAVTWHDVSARYLKFAKNKAKKNGVKINFSLGYIDETPKEFYEKFDLVFNRICWNYCFNDKSFANVINSLLKPGGVVYVDTTHSGWRRETLSFSAKVRTWLNDTFAIKIGHPFPPHGRIACLFNKMPLDRLMIDYSTPTNDRCYFKKLSS